MAIKANFEANDQIYPDAYYKISKLILATADVESYDSDADGNLILAYEKIHEDFAHVFVYLDEESRRKNVFPIKTFAIEFQYDIGSELNAYQQAYIALSNIESFANSKIVNC